MQASRSLLALLCRPGFVRLVLPLLAVGGAGTIGACQLLAGIDDRRVADGGLGDGRADGGSGEAAPPDPCGEIGFPPAPDRSTTNAADAIDVTLALRSVHTGTSAGTLVGPGLGLNLDRVCTCPGPASCAGSSTFCDDAGGVDNEGQQVFAQLESLAAAFDAGQFFNDGLFNNALEKGQSGVLVRVRGYNGKADDAEVSVAIYSSLGSVGNPQWAGNDSWQVDDSYVKANNVDMPLYEVPGWVSDYVLVASPRYIPILIGSSVAQPVKVTLESGHILGKLDVQGGVVRALSGTLAGRWTASDFLQHLEGVPDPVQAGQYLCGTGLTYSIIKGQVCGHRDLASNPDLDGKNTTCDAVSMAIGFDAFPAKLGVLATAPPSITPCDAGNWTACPNN